MNYNKFVCYNIEHNELTRNNEKYLNIPDLFLIKSYEMISSKLSILNSLKTASTVNKNNSHNSNDINKIHKLNKSRKFLNLPIKDYYNQINNINNKNINNIYTPNCMKANKAMSYKHFLSKSIPKQISDKIKIYYPTKSKNSIIINSKMSDIPGSNGMSLIYRLNKYNNNNENILLKELKKSIQIKSSKNINIQNYSHKSSLLLSQKSDNIRYFIDSKGELKNENNIFIIQEEGNKNLENAKNLFNQRLSAHIKRNFLIFRNKKKNNINNQNNNIEIIDDSKTVKNIKTCENEQMYTENIKKRIKSYKIKHSISSADRNSPKLKKIIDNKSMRSTTNKFKKMKNLDKINKNKKKKKKKNKSANNTIRKTKIKHINEKNKSCDNIKIDLKINTQEKEKASNNIENKIYNQIKTSNNNDNKDKNINNNINIKKIIIKNNINNYKNNNINIVKIIKNDNDNKYNNNKNVINIIKKEVNLVNKKENNYAINIKIINSKPISNKIIIAKEKLLDNKEKQENNDIKNNIEKIKEKNLTKIYREIKQSIENQEKKENGINKDNEIYNIRAIETQPKTYKEQPYKGNFHYIKKEESMERIARTRKEYLQRGKSQSLQNLITHFYLIFPGNASYLIKNCMCHRTNWKEAFSNVSSIFNFKWIELSYGIDYNNLGKIGSEKQLVNHYEYHFTISNKANMFINLMNYCERRKLSVFKYVPFTIIYQIKDRRKISNEEKENKWKQNLENLKNFIEKSNKYIKEYNDLGKYYNESNYNEEKEKRKEFNIQNEIKNKKNKLKQKKNKINNNSENINEYSFKVEDEKNGFNGNYILYTDIFPKFEIFEKYISNNENKIGTNTVIEIPKTHHSGKNMWVIKAINLNRGMCIKIVNNFKEMEQVIDKFQKGVDYHFTEQIINEENKEIKNNIIINTNKEENKKENMNEENKDTKKEKEITKEENLKINKEKEKANEENEENKNINLEKEKTKEENKIINKEKEENNEENKNINKKNEKNNEENDIEKNENMYYCDKIIIQKYIENPLLYRGRKCDMRIWVLLTHQMKVYIFKEGHLKTCSVEYDVNSKDAYSHITNYSFQKYNDNFQKFEKGNEVPFFEFQKFIDEKFPEKKYKLNKDLLNQIKEIVNITMRSAKNKINQNGKNYQFEIFGYDFMLDSEFNIYLIEINTNPGLEESSPWIKVIVPRMLDDALRLTLDQIFEPRYDFNLNYKNKEEIINLKNVEINLKNKINPNCLDSNNNKFNGEIKKEENLNENKEIKNVNVDEKNKKYISPFHVPGYELDDNLWEFVCDLNTYDIFENQLDKKKVEEKELYTGIRHLLKKKNIKINSEKNKKEVFNKENKEKKDKIEEKQKGNGKSINKDKEENKEVKEK